MNNVKKTYVISMLLCFCSFLITPAIITVMEEDADVSVFFNVNEEEEHNDSGVEKKGDEIIAFQYPEYCLDQGIEVNEVKAKSALYRSFNFADLLLPPPEHI